LENKQKEIIIAAWLHDVGKFAQRAGIKELYNKNREGQLCKLHEGGWYSHQHVIYTEGFIEKYKDILPDDINVSNVIKYASNHHNPSSYEEWIIAYADRLSSGSDRCNILKNTESDIDEEKLKFYEKPIIQILSTLKIPDDVGQYNKENRIAYCNISALEGESILSSGKYNTSKDEYEKLWKKFESDFLKLKGLAVDNFLLSLDTLCERYWWCIPSATNVDADISLYNHSRTTAAFASALYKFHKDSNSETIQALNNITEKKFCFINGDISGIQKFIFDLKTNEDNAKLLRAKSFQIWALGKIISEYIIKQFDMTDENIITSAGGKFILMVPNSEKVKQFLPSLQCEIEEYFLNEYCGKLSVIISDGIEATSKDIQKENVQNLILKIGYISDVCKQRKMQKALQKNGAVLDDLYEELQKNGECPKCGIFPASKPYVSNTELSRDCPSCKNLTEIGRDLVKASLIKLNSDNLCHFGDMVRVYRKTNDFGYLVNNYEPGKPVIYLPYVAPWKNEKEGILKTFEEIAEESTGNKKIAMFKADIDNLGLLFSSSLGSRMSFSRYSEMSQMLHYFFSGYYEWFVRNHMDHNGKKYEDTIYTVFSGGDDLCILGAWDSVMHFASDFRKELLKLTNCNPDITISGGIVLSNSNVPVRDLAYSAEDALDKSKEMPNKNSITVFDTTVSWEEYDECLNNGVKIQKYLETNEKKNDSKISVGIVYKMIEFSERAKTVKKGNVKELLNNIHAGTWLSNFHYLITRNIKDNEVRTWFLNEFGNQEKMINSRISVSYALYTQRNN